MASKAWCENPSEAREDLDANDVVGMRGAEVSRVTLHRRFSGIGLHTLSMQGGLPRSPRLAAPPHTPLPKIARRAPSPRLASRVSPRTGNFSEVEVR